MGVFDYIRCKMPLPSDPAPPSVEWFQTKDTEAQYMERYTIETDGRAPLPNDGGEAVSDSRRCYVYLIEMPELAADGDGFYKVGISATPAARLSAFATASPFKVAMRVKRLMPNRLAAYSIEQRFHADDAQWRRAGEWFFSSVVGALCEIDYLILRYWVEEIGTPVGEVEPHLLDAGIGRSMIPDLIGSEYGEPPYDVVCAP